MKFLVLSVLCVINFLLHGMEVASAQTIKEANENNPDGPSWDVLIKNVEVVNALEKNNSDFKNLCIKEPGGYGECVLMFAAADGDIELANALIKAGININRRDNHGESALFSAIEGGHLAVVNLLIESGADIHTTNRYGCTALGRAVSCKNITLINALIEAGADRYGGFALERAIKHYEPEVIVALINPTVLGAASKKIELLLMIYQEKNFLSDLPKEILKVIITYAYPEYAMDCELIRGLYPHILVDIIPVQGLNTYIKNGILDKDIILGAWKQKLIGIDHTLNELKVVTNQMRFYDTEDQFVCDGLAKIYALLTE